MQTQNDLTRFEKLFDDLELGNGLASTRIEAFDFEHSLFFSPLRYKQVPVDHSNFCLPSEDWIASSFVEFVKAEFTTDEKIYAPKFPSYLPHRSCDFFATATSVRNTFEQRYVFGDMIGDLVEGTNVFSAKERLYKIFTSEEFGRRANSTNVPFQEFKEKLHHIKVGLRCIALGLPFRDQNRFRTQSDAGDVTMAEALFLVRLHCIALAAYQVLPTGADFLVLSDGNFYRDLFEIAPQSSEMYLRDVRRLRNRLNLGGTVQIVDLQEVIRKFDDNKGVFQSAEKFIYDVLSIKAVSDGLSGALASMEFGFRRNFSTRMIKASDQEVVDWLNFGTSSNCSLPDQLEIRNKTLAYASRNLALKWLKVIATMFPTCVRSTMHPKKDQLGLPRMGSTFPWNGIALVDEKNTGLDEMTIASLDLAANKYRALRPVHSETGTVVYYEGVS